MIIDDANTTNNYHRHHNRDIRATIEELTPERKQKLLDKITLRKGACHLITREYNHHDCEYIEKLLIKECKQ